MNDQPETIGIGPHESALPVAKNSGPANNATRESVDSASQTTLDLLGRTEKDFAIEFAGYLADTVEDFLEAYRLGGEVVDTDKFTALANAVYEFRKRASRV